MAEDKNINLMPEDLRKKEDLIKKSNWSFTPDLSSPLNTKTKGAHASKESGSNPSLWSKLFSSLKPVPKVKPVPVLNTVSESKEKIEIAAPTPVIKSPIFIAPDIKAMEAKATPKVDKVEEHIQDFVSDKKIKEVKLKSSGPSFWSKLFSSSKSAPKIKPLPNKTPVNSEKTKVEPKVEPLVIPTIKSPIYTAPIISPITTETNNNIKTGEHIQDFVSNKKIKEVKLKSSGPSWWERLLSFFKPKPRAPKPAKQNASVLTQAVKRNGYKIETANVEMHQASKQNVDVPKQDFKDLNQKVEDILETKPPLEKVAKASEEADIILPMAEAKPEIVKPEPVMPDFTIPSMPTVEKLTKSPVVPAAPVENNKFHQPDFLRKNGLMGEIGNVDLIPQAAKMRSWRQINGLLSLAGVASLIIIGVFYGALVLQEQAIIKEQKLQQTAMLEVEKKVLNFNDLNKNIKVLGEEINLVQEALNKHIYWTKFFTLLEKYTLPEVYYSGLSAGDNGALTLGATTNNYEAVARQLKVLQSEEAKEFVTSVSISGARKDNNDVGFSINLVLNPDLFYYDKQ
jgi:hypothetical protein